MFLAFITDCWHPSNTLVELPCVTVSMLRTAWQSNLPRQKFWLASIIDLRAHLGRLPLRLCYLLNLILTFSIDIIMFCKSLTSNVRFRWAVALNVFDLRNHDFLAFLSLFSRPLLLVGWTIIFLVFLAQSYETSNFYLKPSEWYFGR